ncbi:hypothetical protein [Mesobacillus foraminis]|uniref:hypothetical protein n=1 Tax=Mesobacillus foraminis TaxID=279826 RepID=UPI000EF4B45C|nr:hypothetical protein [Mesobacillus foraminis]
MVIHNKQFLISNKEYILEEWNSLRVLGGLYLSFSPNLPILHAKDSDGKGWYILGDAYQTDPNKQSPYFEITSNTTEKIKNLINTWSGRWVLIGPNELYLDACGLLGCYIYSNGREIAISSSYSLINEFLKTKLRVSKNITYGMQMNWFPPPYTSDKLISKLLPSQKLSIKNNKIVVQKNQEYKNINKNLGYHDRLHLIKESLITEMRNIYAENNDIRIALTGGYDSRVILATAISANIPFQTFTQRYNFISNSDIIIPKIISESFNFKHTIINQKKFSKEKVKDFDFHSGCMSMDADRFFYGNGQWDDFDSKCLIIRGGILPLGKIQFSGKLSEGLSNQNEIVILNEVEKLFGLEYKDYCKEKESLREWVKWLKKYPDDLDFNSRLFLEQKIGGWMSSIEQSLDLTNTRRIHLGNSKSIISNLVFAPKALREKKQLHIDLINLLCPELLDIPFNLVSSNKSNLITKIKREGFYYINSSNKKLYLKKKFLKLYRKI